jgi:hypothetical protein
MVNSIQFSVAYLRGVSNLGGVGLDLTFILLGLGWMAFVNIVDLLIRIGYKYSKSACFSSGSIYCIRAFDVRFSEPDSQHHRHHYRASNMIALLVIAILFVFVQNVSAQSLPPNSPVILERNLANCSMAQVTSCSVDDPTIEVLVYCNGVRIRALCSSGSSQQRILFPQPLSDTITLINTSYTTGTSLSSLSVGCASAQASGELPYPTPTPYPIPDDATSHSRDRVPHRRE